MEDGFKCEGNPSVCSPTNCGDGIREGAESCDDGNTVPFDGCSMTCQAEPICETGQPCTSRCGDGITFNTEECDDGNLRDGDGCSSACEVEIGFTCTQEETECQGEDCFLELPIIYRDFSEAHSDFGVQCATIERGIPNPRLTADGKPELSAASFEDACIASSASYAEWYTSASSNAEAVGTIRLYPNGDGGYVNRYGENGEPYVTTMDTGNEQGGYGTDLASCEATCTQRTRDSLQCENVCRPAHDAVDQATRELTQEQDAQGPILDRIAELEAEIVALEESAAQCDADCAAPCEDVCQPEHDAVDQATLELTQEQDAAVPDLDRIAELEAEIVTLEETAAQCDADCVAPCEDVCQPEHDAVDQTTQALTQQQSLLAPHVDRIAELQPEIAALEATAAQCDVDCAAEFATREAECQALCAPCSFNDQQWCIGGEYKSMRGSSLDIKVQCHLPH